MKTTNIKDYIKSLINKGKIFIKSCEKEIQSTEEKIQLIKGTEKKQ